MRRDLPFHLKRRPTRAEFAMTDNDPAVMAGIVSIQNEDRAGEGTGHMLQQLLAKLQQIDHRPVLDTQAIRMTGASGFARLVMVWRTSSLTGSAST